MAWCGGDQAAATPSAADAGTEGWLGQLPSGLAAGCSQFGRLFPS